MDITDYLIDRGNKDWAALLEDWMPPLPSRLTVWMVNRLGDVIAGFEDGSIHFLDIGNGQLTRLAEDRNDFIALIVDNNNADNWLAIDLVNQCAAAGMMISDDQCYGYKVPPFLGGDYEISNLEPTNLSVHYSLLAQLWKQTRDLPVGSRISAFTID